MEFRLHPEFVSCISWVSWQKWFESLRQLFKMDQTSSLRNLFVDPCHHPTERSYQIPSTLQHTSTSATSETRKLPSGYKVFVACNPLGSFRSRASSHRGHTKWDLMMFDGLWPHINKLISNQIGLQKKSLQAYTVISKTDIQASFVPSYSFQYQQLLQLQLSQPQSNGDHSSCNGRNKHE